MSDWIKCSERMPGPRQCVLVCTKGNYVTVSRWINGWGKNITKHYWEGMSSREPSDITHWMPYPEPPKESP